MPSLWTRYKDWGESFNHPMVLRDDRGEAKDVHPRPNRPPEAAAAFRRARPPRAAGWTGVGFAIYLIARLLYELVESMFAGAIGKVGVLVLFIVLAVAGALIFRHFQRGSEDRRARTNAERSIVHAHFIRRCFAATTDCPCCGYALTELEPEADGCRVCPECGAAWRIEAWTNDGREYRFPAVKPRGSQRSYSATQIADGRGLPVTVLGSVDRRDRLVRIRREVRPPAAKVRTINRDGGLLVLVIVGVTAGLAWMLDHRFTDVACFALPVLVLSALVCAWWVHSRVGQLAATEFARRQVAKGLCPCCEHQLRDTPSPIDGCLLCDHCGCGWKPESA